MRFSGFKGQYTGNHQPNMEGKAVKSATCPCALRGYKGSPLLAEIVQPTWQLGVSLSYNWDTGTSKMGFWRPKLGFEPCRMKITVDQSVYPAINQISQGNGDDPPRLWMYVDVFIQRNLTWLCPTSINKWYIPPRSAVLQNVEHDCQQFEEKHKCGKWCSALFDGNAQLWSISRQNHIPKKPLVWMVRVRGFLCWLDTAEVLAFFR